MRICVAFLLVLLFLSCVPVQAASTASTTAKQVNMLFDKKIPYTIDISEEKAITAGFDVANLTNRGTYKIIIKSIKYDPNEETTVLYLNAWRNGESVKVNNPVHIYMPWAGGIKGATTTEQLKNYEWILVNFIDGLPLGKPVNDDTALIYSSNDARLRANTAGSFWQVLRDNAGTSVSNNEVLPSCINTIAGTTADNYTYIQRCGFQFNTSVVGSGGTVTSAVFGTKFLSRTVTLKGQNESSIVVGTPANPNLYVAGDYDALNLASPTELASRFDFTNTASGNINFTFNAAGISAINKTGNFTIYMLDGDELDNSFTGVWGSGLSRVLRLYGTSDATESNRPYLQIIYTPGAPADTTPPTSITGLTNTTGCSWIKWDWTNPTDSDFNHTYIMKDNAFFTNLSNTTTSSNWTPLSQLTEYTFSSHTCDITGNCNTTWVNGTSTTLECTTPTPTPTPAGNCSFLNVTGVSILQNSTNLSMAPVILLGVYLSLM